MERIRLYNLLNVKASYITKEEVSGRFVFTTENVSFKKKYITHIPVSLTEEEWLTLKRQPRRYKGMATPILHSIKLQAIKFLKENNKLK